MFKSSVHLINKKLVRHASSRNKKIPVQLLKDFAGVGSRGEIVQVKPSIMRHKLHPYDGAAYILKDQGPVIPVVAESTVLKLQEKEKLRKEAQEHEEIQRKLQKEPATVFSLKSLSKLISNSKSIKDMNEINVVKSEEAVYNFETINSLPHIIKIKQVSSKGYLEKYISRSDLSKTIFNLTGATVPEESIKIKYISSKPFTDVEEIDFVGTYSLTVSIPSDTRNITKDIFIDSAEYSDELVRPETRPDSEIAAKTLASGV